MKYVYSDGTILELVWDYPPTFIGYEDDHPEGKVMDCPSLIVLEGQTVGEAACLSTCSCLFCRTLRISGD